MSQKSVLHLNKSAYLQLDFVFAVFLFFIAFFFIFEEISGYKEQVSHSQEQLNLESFSKDFCYILTSSPGVPSNWESNVSSLEVLGLKNISSNVLNSNKISNLSSNTSLYYLPLDRISEPIFYYFNIEGVNSNTNYLEFGYSSQEGVYSSSYTCYSSYNQELVRVFVEVWK